MNASVAVVKSEISFSEKCQIDVLFGAVEIKGGSLAPNILLKGRPVLDGWTTLTPLVLSLHP